MAFDDTLREAQPDDLAERMLGGRLSRRLLMRRAALLGLSMPVVAGLLAACGDDDDDDPTAAATTAPSGTTPTTAPSGATPTTGAPATATTGGGPTATAGGAPATATTGAPPATATAALEGKPGGKLVWGLLRDPIGFDPHIAYGASSSSLQGNVYDLLVEYDLEGGLTGGLAEQWEISDDGLNYTFSLVQGVVFHDGADFTSEDVVFTFDRIRDEANNLTRRTQLSNMESYEATDDSTIEVVLAQPYATLLAVLATPEVGMASKAWFESGADPVTEMNGTGPFMLESFEPQVKAVLVKNPNFWKPGLPYLDSIEQVPIPEDTARMNSFFSGEINFVEYIPWQNMAEIADNSDYTMYKGFDTYNLVRLNPTVPPLDNKLVRQAMNYAIDREAVIAVAFGGEGQPLTSGLLPTVSPWYNQELDGHWTYDPDKALALLEEANVDPASVNLTFAAATISVHMDTAQVVAQQLQALGMNITIEQQDVPTLTERRTTGDYQMMQDGLGLSYPDPDAYAIYFAIGASQYAKAVNYENQTLDDLLNQGRAELDPEKRKAIYLEFEKELLEDAPWIFILYRPQAEAVAKNVMGYTRIPGLGLGSERYMETVWIDE